ncbi:MAG: hypothetical protein WC455_17320 [Dehalococcoidia bacterium]|jgi:hypothetical protein
MKKIIGILVAVGILFMSIPAIMAWNSFTHRSPSGTRTTIAGVVSVASGTYAAGALYADLTTANAFAAPADLSSYQDGNHILWASDGTNTLMAWISATAPGGETLDVEKISNPSFDLNTNGWVGSGATLASVAGGQTNNCLELTRTSGTTQLAYVNPVVAIDVGALVKVTAYIKSGSSGNESCRIGLQNSSSTYLGTTSGTSSGDWVLYTVYGTTNTATTYVASLEKRTDTAGTMLFDTASAKRVTDCAATGALLLSTKGGARGFISLPSAFNGNLAGTYRILRSY